MFGLFPLFRQIILNKSNAVQCFLLVLASIINILLIFHFSPIGSIIYFVILFFIALITPLLFIYAYQFKK